MEVPMLQPVTFFKCLSDDTRLKALLLISLKGELCVCDLHQALQLSQPKVSRHLAELRKCDLVSDERRGKWVYYRIHPTLPSWAVEVLIQTTNHNSSYLQECLERLADECLDDACCSQ
jgi:ArsR family transcriptional regulator, arsenate/arsenite/antimonite-responsive transcriptional repressor